MLGGSHSLGPSMVPLAAQLGRSLRGRSTEQVPLSTMQPRGKRLSRAVRLRRGGGLVEVLATPLGWCGPGSLGDSGSASPALGVEAWMECGPAASPPAMRPDAAGQSTAPLAHRNAGPQFL